MVIDKSISSDEIVSVIVPSYNRKHQLKRCLESLSRLSRKPDEIIVIDDGSSDDTSEMVRVEYPRIKLLKNELINKHLLEISSGSEILRRLIKKGLISEFPDDIDRRAKRVSLTEQGRMEIMNAFDDMHKVSEIIIGNLNDTELNEALSVFEKLTYFHHHIHEKDRNTALNELHQKYISN